MCVCAGCFYHQRYMEWIDHRRKMKSRLGEPIYFTRSSNTEELGKISLPCLEREREAFQPDRIIAILHSGTSPSVSVNSVNCTLSQETWSSLVEHIRPIGLCCLAIAIKMIHGYFKTIRWASLVLLVTNSKRHCILQTCSTSLCWMRIVLPFRLCSQPSLAQLFMTW